MGIRFIPEKTKYRFVRFKYICIALSFLVLLATALSIYYKGFNFGIDFQGGLIMEVQSDKPIDLSAVRGVLGKGVILQDVGDNKTILLKSPPRKNQNQEQQVNELKSQLAKAIPGKIEYRRAGYVGPQVGKELINGSAMALGFSFLAIFLYLWFRFEWQYGVGGILALLHDAVGVLGFYSFTGFEFDLTSVAAILTVIGYSINDSVVIYDRVRENVRKYKKMPLGDLLDLSINETLSRTIMTAGTTSLALLSLCIFGGEVIRSFSAGMLFGVVIGTYSSIYISAILLIFLDPRKAENNRIAKEQAETKTIGA